MFRWWLLTDVVTSVLHNLIDLAFWLIIIIKYAEWNQQQSTLIFLVIRPKKFTVNMVLLFTVISNQTNKTVPPSGEVFKHLFGLQQPQKA